MDGSNGGSNAPAPFLTKTYEMVDDPMTNPMVAWSHTGRSFIVWNPPEFARDLLPKYFKHNNFSSFIRQLNTYGFRKVDPDQWEFANEEFIRGQKNLLKNIHRRKPIHSHSSQGSGAVPVSDAERLEFEEEIERLKRDNSLLQSELERHKQENREYGSDIGSLGQRLKDIDSRQRQLLAFLAQLLQKPGFANNLMQHSENQSKKRRLFVSNYLCDEANNEGSQLVTFKEENPNALFPMLNLDLITKLDSSINFWENFAYGMCQTSADELYDFGVVPMPPPVIVTELHASSGDSDVNLQPCSSNSFHSSPSRDFHSSPEAPGSSNHIDSSAISSLYPNIDSRQKSSGIDVNTSPSSFMDTDVPKDTVEGNGTVSAPTGTNDVFWQQFLTETPGSLEGQLERTDIDLKRNDSGSLANVHKPWWSRNNLDNLTEQMGHLTPAERT